VLRLVDSAQRAHARLAASIGRTLFAAIDELARAIANLANYSTRNCALARSAPSTARLRIDAPVLRQDAPALSPQEIIL
jgi:hypothetical protein